MVRSGSVKYSAAQIGEMVARYVGGLSFQESGSIFGADPKTVYQYVKKAGLPTRTLSEGYRNAERAGKQMSNAPRKFKVENYFENIGPEEAWVLGLWLGDGCITSNGYKAVLAVGEDRDVGEKVIKILGFTGDLRMSSCSDKCWLLEVWSKKFVDALRSTGLKERKSKTFGLLDINDDLMPHLIRGIWDADGSWGRYPRKDRPTKALTTSLGLTSDLAVGQIATIASRVIGAPVNVRVLINKGFETDCKFSRIDMRYLQAKRWGGYLYGGSDETIRCSRKYNIWAGVV